MLAEVTTLTPVIPRDSPTVPYAETNSKTEYIKSMLAAFILSAKSMNPLIGNISIHSFDLSFIGPLCQCGRYCGLNDIGT